MTLRAPTWLDGEPGLRDALGELARVLRRSARRAVRVVLATAAIALAVIGLRVRKDPLYPARIVLRVSENDRGGAANAPRPKRHLREYVLDAVFSNQQLTRIIEERKLYPDIYRRDPPAAVVAFREDIDVAVYRNYFIEDRAANDPTRSARIAIGYRSSDPRLAIDVVQELGQLIVVHEAAIRHDQTVLALRDATKVVDSLRGDVVKQKHELEDRVAAAGAGAPPDLPGLTLSLHAAEQRLAEAQRLKSELELNASAERQQVALRFDVVDQAGAHRVEPRTSGLVLLALLVLLFAAPLCAVAVGAFDARIYGADDVRRLGIAVLGLVPAYPGDDVGSLVSRGLDRGVQ